MSERQRPKRFQIHLSTAIVLMIAAGIVLWANTGGRASPNIKGYSGGGWLEQRYGWPSEAARTYLPVEGGEWSIETSDTVWRIQGVAIDLAVALVILFAVGFVCERLIRRRAAQKQGGGS